MPKKLTLALLILSGVAIPMSVEGTQNRDDGVFTVGEIINIDAATRTLEMESAPIGTLRVEGNRPFNGALGVADLDRFPPPVQSEGPENEGRIEPPPCPPTGPDDGRTEPPPCLLTGPDDGRIEPPPYPPTGPDDGRIERPPYPLPRRGPRNPSIAVRETTDGFPIRDRQVRQGYLSFDVSIDDATELIEEGRAILFTSLAVGDRITVLGKVDGTEIGAYRITRILPPEEESN